LEKTRLAEAKEGEERERERERIGYERVLLAREVDVESGRLSGVCIS